MFKVYIFLIMFLSGLYGATSDFLGGDMCQYNREHISYRGSDSIDSVVTISAVLQASNSEGLCRNRSFQKDFTSSHQLLTRESGLLSFIFDEYLGYSIYLSSSSKIVKRLIDFNSIHKIQNRHRDKIERLIIDLGFPLSEIQQFGNQILSSLSIVDIYCLDYYTIFYKQEKEKLEMLKEYAALFQEYKLSTEVSNLVFKEIIQGRTEYLESLKQIFILSLSDNM